jgi:DNA ligase-1
MIKNPDCDYQGVRTKNLLKVKKFEDAEATVLGHVKGTGRCSFMTGAIEVVNKDGKQFKIGSGFSDA